MELRGSALIFGLLVACAGAQKIQIKDRGEEFDKKLKNLTESNNLDETASYRCGIFFAGDNPQDPPRHPIFVIPKRFEMDCGQEEETRLAQGQKECYDLFSFILTKITLESASRKRDGFTIGDDLCEILSTTGLKKLPGPGHPKFPAGITVGFYYNVCTDTKWYDTELRVGENVCCVTETKKNIKC